MMDIVDVAGSIYYRILLLTTLQSNLYEYLQAASVIAVYCIMQQNKEFEFNKAFDSVVYLEH